MKLSNSRGGESVNGEVYWEEMLFTECGGVSRCLSPRPRRPGGDGGQQDLQSAGGQPREWAADGGLWEAGQRCEHPPVVVFPPITVRHDLLCPLSPLSSTPLLHVAPSPSRCRCSRQLQGQNHKLWIRIQNTVDLRPKNPESVSGRLNLTVFTSNCE